MTLLMPYSAKEKRTPVEVLPLRFDLYVIASILDLFPTECTSLSPSCCGYSKS